MHGPFIRRKGIWRPQFVPSGPVEIDWSHPPARDLAVLYIPGAQSGWNDLCGNAPPLLPVPSSGVSLRPGTKGVGFYSPPSGSSAPQATTAGLPPAFKNLNGYIFASTDQENVNIGNSPYIWTAPGYVQLTAITNPNECYAQVSNANYVQFTAPSTGFFSSVFDFYNTSAAGSMYGFMDGKLNISGPGQAVDYSNGFPGYTQNTFQMGGDGSSHGQTIFFAGAYFKPPSPDLIAWHGVEPLAMLCPKVRRTYGIALPSDGATASGAAAFGAIGASGSETSHDSATGAGGFSTVSGSGAATSKNTASGAGSFGQMNAPGSAGQSDTAGGAGGFGAVSGGGSAAAQDSAAGLAGVSAMGASAATTATDAGHGAGTFPGVSASGLTQMAGQDNASGTVLFGSLGDTAASSGNDPAQEAGGFGQLASSGNAAAANSAAGNAAFSGLSVAAQAAGITAAIVTGHATFGPLIALGSVTMNDAANTLAGFGPVIASGSMIALVGFDVTPGRTGTFPADRRSALV